MKIGKILVPLFVWINTGLMAQPTGLPVTSNVEKEVTIRDSIMLQYVEQGDTTGIPVILLHGYTDSWHSFELVLPLLPKNLHVFAVTQRGHGGSGKPANGYRMNDFADDLAAFMQQLSIEPAVIVGHSMGSVIAQCFAVRHPQRVRSLVLAGAFAVASDNKDVVDLKQLVDRFDQTVDQAFVTEFQKSTVKGSIPAAFLQTVIDESLRVPVAVWKLALAGMMEESYLRQLKQIDKPVLILWGSADVFCPEKDQYLLRRNLKYAQWKIYPMAGHALHWERPERFSADMISFIEETAR